MEDYRLTHRPYSKTKQTLEEFLGYSKRTNLGDVTRIDVLKYGEWLLKNKRSPRTACDKFLTVHSFLKSKGIKLVSGRDAPKYVEEMPEVYTQEELDAFFKACDSTESLIFAVFLKVGLRERELIHLEWSDLNFKESTLGVSAKAHYGWVTTREGTVLPCDEMAPCAPHRSLWAAAHEWSAGTHRCPPAGRCRLRPALIRSRSMERAEKDFRRRKCNCSSLSLSSVK